METKIPSDDELNEIYKVFKTHGIEPIPAQHENHQMAIMIPGEKPIKVLLTLATFE